MDYNKMKKEDLIKLLEEQSHLASAVDAKDKEITTLNKKNKERFEALAREAKEEKERLIKDNKELQDKLNKVPNVDKLTEFTKKLQEENKKLIQFIEMYVMSFRSYLKAQQGSLDNVIELEGMISNKLNEKGVE